MKLEQFEHCGNGPITYSDPFAAYLTVIHKSVADVMKHSNHVYGTESLNSKSIYCVLVSKSIAKIRISKPEVGVP